jgi:wyosine [tRNA(Phe)-imidazoG37] synthetase (radical SAM superfamily)
MGANDPMMITFGPVPSRRLGRSLGINNIPHKICSYSCVYCQVGRTRRFQLERTEFYDPKTIAREVGSKVSKARENGEIIDYLTFVPDGEPTLDSNLAATIELLKPLGVRIGVITNSSLLAHENVRSALMGADWVSCKLDSVIEEIWRRINRPHSALELDGILDGILELKSRYRGTLVTETMLVKGLNDGEGNLSSIAVFLGRLQPAVAYLSIPTRPPAESWVKPPGEQTVARAHQILGAKVARVEHLIGYEGNAFASTGNPVEDLLSITAVHPMREEAVSELLQKARADWPVVHEMVEQGLLVETGYEGRKYFIRKFPKSGRAP